DGVSSRTTVAEPNTIRNIVSARRHLRAAPPMSSIASRPPPPDEPPALAVDTDAEDTSQSSAAPPSRQASQSELAESGDRVLCTARNYGPSRHAATHKWM